jgi:ABC-2 type transport system permease protein
VNLGRLGSIVWKEFVQMRRDRATLGMMLGIPVVQLLVFGYAIRTEVRDLPTVVFDQSRTRPSRELVQRLEATDNFRVVAYARSYEAAIRLVDAGRARAAVVIPPEYAARIAQRRPVAVQVLVDATDPLASQNAIAAAQLIGQLTNLDLLPRPPNALPRRWDSVLEMRVRPLYNPALKSANFIVPGVIGMILSITLMIITSVAIVRERERGTFEQLIVTPLSKSEIMIGKIAPYVLVGYAQMTAVLTLGHFLFRVPMRGDLLLVYAITFLFIVANLGIGLFISTIARSQAQAMQISYFFVLPNVLLSGFMFPREGMPPLAREVGLLFPLTYFLKILRGILLKGVGLGSLWPEVVALLGFAVLFFAFSVQRFHKNLD